MKKYRKAYRNVLSKEVIVGPWFRYKANAETSNFPGEQYMARLSNWVLRMEEKEIGFWSWLWQGEL